MMPIIEANLNTEIPVEPAFLLPAIKWSKQLAAVKQLTRLNELENWTDEFTLIELMEVCNCDRCEGRGE